MQPKIISEIKSQIIEVPVIEETVRHVRKIEVVEVEKKVPKYEIEYVERVVEIPQIKIVEQYEEYEVVQEVAKYVPKKEFVSVPREVIRYEPKIETTFVEKIVEVLSRDQIIEIRKPYTVDQAVPYPVYKDREVSCVVAQKMIPVVRESTVELLDVEVCKFVPQVIPVDVYIPRPVQVPLIPVKKSDDIHSRVEVPAPQFNTLLVNLNSHLSCEERLIVDLPFRLGGDGNIPMLMSDQFNSTVTIASDQGGAFEQRGFEQRGFGQRDFEQRAFEQRAFDQRAFDQRAFERWGFEQRVCEQRACDQKFCDRRVCDPRFCDQRACKHFSCEQRGCQRMACRQAVPCEQRAF